MWEFRLKSVPGRGSDFACVKLRRVATMHQLSVIKAMA